MKIYHYTTVKAFCSIIEKNKLWLSERNCMNDVFDENYIKDIVYCELSNSPAYDGGGFR